VTVREAEAKSILRKQKRTDSWFVSRYGMNLYRGCTHNCVYCDGRAEKYRVDGEFGRDVVVKVNAIELLRRELDPRRKRMPLKQGFVMLGGGVGDSYQPAERQYGLTRQAMELMLEYGYPVHVLTKSTLVERDLDLLNRINEQSRAIVSFSFSSVDDDTSHVFEPGVPPPSERLSTLKRFKNEGIACGMFLLPVIPLVTDTPERIDESVRTARDAGLDFVVFGGMTLKDGRQREYFQRVLSQQYPGLIPEYDKLYPGSKWGQVTPQYYAALHARFNEIRKRYGVPPRIPARLFRDILDENDLVSVILEQMDYLLMLEGRSSPFRYAAWSVSQLKEPISTMRSELQSLKGVGEATERVILEIIGTGTSSHYEKLIGEANR
jgi:DNA repair photolyase